MSVNKTAIVVVVCALAAVAWLAGYAETDKRGLATSPTEPVATTATGRAHVTPPVIAPVDPFPDPIDFANVDRDRDLHGRILDESGAAVAGARVEVYRTPWRSRRLLNVDERFEEVAVAETRAARDGSFRVELAPGERVSLRASHDGYAPTAIAVCLAGGRVDVTLVGGVTLNVVVLGPRGEPAVGATVRLSRSEHLFPGEADVHAEGVTDSTGVCRLTELQPGGSGRVTVAHESGSAWLANTNFPTDGEARVEVRLPKGRLLSGVVRDAETGDPIPGASISDEWTFGRVLRSGVDGRFALPNATSETFALYAKADGYAVGGVSISAETEATIELSRAIVATGRFLDPDGEPVSNARIAIISDNFGSNARVKAYGRSGADGRFRIGGLRCDAQHVVIVIAEGLVRYLTDTDAPGTPGGTLDVGDIELPHGRRVSGRVTDETGAPIAHAVVKLSGSNADRSRLRVAGGAVAEFYGGEETCWSDDLGRFHFTDVAPGSYSLIATVMGRKNASARTEVVDTDVEDIALPFVVGHRFRVRVKDDRGDPVSMVTVTATTADRWSLSLPTRAAGLADFNSDSRVVSVRAFSWNNGADRFVAQSAVPVAEGDDETEIILTRVAVASGVAMRPDGLPLSDARFRVLVDGKPLAQESPFERVGYVRATGEFKALVPRGENAVIELLNSSYEDAKTGVAIRVIGRIAGVSGGDTDLVLHARALPNDRSCDVSVLDPDGRPIAGASVWGHLFYASKPLAHVTTSRSGRGFLDHLQAARYTVLAALPEGHPGRATWVPPSEVITPSGQQVSLHFAVGDLVQGKIVDAEGAPMSGVTIEIYAMKRRLVQHTSQKDGSFAFALDPATTRPLYFFAYKLGDPAGRVHRDDAFEPGTGLKITLRAP